MKRHQLRNVVFLTATLVAATLFLVYAQGSLAQGETELCISQLGVDPAFPNPPTLDGVVEDWVNPSPTPNPLEHDPGWNRAAKINLRTDSAGSLRTAKMLVGQTATDVWLALTVETGIAPGENDTVVLMLATDNDAAHDWRIHIKPFTPANAGSTRLNFKDDVPDVVTYARDSANWNNAPPATGGGNTFTPSAIRAPWLFVRDTAGLPVTTGKLRVSRNGNIWSLEMRIPRVPLSAVADATHPGIFFPDDTHTPSTFRMYVNVISTDNLLGTFHDAPWPSTTQAHITGPLTTTGPTTLEFNTPPKNTSSGTPIWGTASTFPRSECTGIFLNVGDIGVEDPASTLSPRPLISDIRTIATASLPSPYPTPTGGQTEVQACLALADGTFPASLSNVNTFAARPTSTLSFTPSHMKTTFRIANFGIPAPPQYQAWHVIVGEAGATTVTNPVECGGTTGTPCTFTSGVRNVTMPWRLSYKQSCIYSKARGGHQCIMVELESDDGAVRFLNKSVMRNMDFVPASRIERSAEISAIGYPAPPAGRSKQQFIIAVDTSLQKYSIASGRLSATDPRQRLDQRYLPRIGTEEIRNLLPRYFPQGVSDVMVWQAKGYRRTGNHLTIWKRDFEYAEPVGAFTYVAGHNGEVKEWLQSFGGSGLTRVADDLYTLEILPGEVAIVDTVIEAVEPGTTTPPGFRRWGLSLHGGTSFPHGNFNTLFNPGGNFGVDLEYRINPIFSLEAIYTFHRFRGETLFGLPIGDLNVHQFSLNGKVYGSSSPVRPFFNFGGGAYKFDPGSTRGGLNIGGGVQFDVTPNIAIDTMYNFHNVFTSGSSTRFSTLQGGVRFRF